MQDLPTQCGVFFTMNQFVSFLSFRSFSTGQICQRWHKDKVANRHCYRYFFSMCIAYKVITHKEPFKYYVSKEVGRWGQKMAILLIYSTIYADVGGWA